MKERTTKTRPRKDTDDMRAEYDFSGGVRGKYAARYTEGTNVAILSPDVARVFRNSTSVNAALRALIKAKARKSGRTLQN
jgi:hypothetical protein